MRASALWAVCVGGMRRALRRLHWSVPAKPRFANTERAFPPVPRNASGCVVCSSLRRGDWYRTPGPIQFHGPGSAYTSVTLRLELGGDGALAEYLEGNPAAAAAAKRGRMAAAGGAGSALAASVPAASTRGVSDLNALFTYRPRHPRTMSALQRQRLKYEPELPPVFSAAAVATEAMAGASTTTESPDDAELLARVLPKTFAQPLLALRAASGTEATGTDALVGSGAVRVGVVFCGRQAPGVHNVLWGLQRGLKRLNAASVCLGFEAGTQGMFVGRAVELTDERLDLYRNQGGMDCLGRSSDQVRTPAQLTATAETCHKLKLAGLVMVGGTHTQADVALVAEHFASTGLNTRVVGVPSGIDGDLPAKFVEASVGFHTATSLYAQLIGNLATDANS